MQSLEVISVNLWQILISLLNLLILFLLFKKFLFKPYPGDLQHAKGSVRTPYGLIQVEWQQEQEGLQVHLICPPDCTAITENYPEAPIKEIRLEHQKILL